MPTEVDVVRAAGVLARAWKANTLRASHQTFVSHLVPVNRRLPAQVPPMQAEAV